MAGEWCDTVDRLSSLARVALGPGERERMCLEIRVIAEYLRSVGEALRGVDVEPLYHVWEEESWLRPGGEPERVDLALVVGGERLDEEGRLKVPWREVK